VVRWLSRKVSLCKEVRQNSAEREDELGRKLCEAEWLGSSTHWPQNLASVVEVLILFVNSR
jgi:hypothetical protein